MYKNMAQGVPWVKDLALLWLSSKPAAAAPIGPLNWELPYATGMSVKRNKDYSKENNPSIWKGSTKYFSFAFVGFFGHAHSLWKFPGQGSNPSISLGP